MDLHPVESLTVHRAVLRRVMESSERQKAEKIEALLRQYETAPEPDKS